MSKVIKKEIPRNRKARNRKKIKYVYEGSNTLHRDSGPALIEFWYNSSDKAQIEKYYKNGKLHRDDGPAVTEYFIDGSVRTLEYYKNGKLHRIDQPAIIEYGGRCVLCESFFENGKPSINKPAIINYHTEGYSSKQGCVRDITYKSKTGKKHRTNGPAYLKFNDKGDPITEIYFRYGNKHRENGPAQTKWMSSGDIEMQLWYRFGILHNTNGPALIDYGCEEKPYFKRVEYYIDGTLHRDNEPAIVEYKGKKEILRDFYHHGKCMTEIIKEWCDKNLLSFDKCLNENQKQLRKIQIGF